MGTYEGALVALDTFIRLPLRHMGSNAALFKGCSSRREGTVLHSGKGADRKIISLALGHGKKDFVDEFREVTAFFPLFFQELPVLGNGHLHNLFDAAVHGLTVHGNDPLALFAVGLFNSFLQVFYSIIQRNDIGQLEEGRLHDHVDTVSETDALCDLGGIYNIEIQFFFGDDTLHLLGKLVVQLLFIPDAVQKEGSALLQILQHIILADVGLVMTGYEIRLIDQISRLDRMLSEPQMGYGKTAGFLGIVIKIALCVQVGLITDDFDGSLICTYRSIRTQTPEFTFDGALRLSCNSFDIRKGMIGYVVIDTNGKVVLRTFVV